LSLIVQILNHGFQTNFTIWLPDLFHNMASVFIDHMVKSEEEKKHT